MAASDRPRARPLSVVGNVNSLQDELLLSELARGLSSPAMEGAASGDPKARTLVLGRLHYHL
jgi:hypothetical protein